MKINYHDNSKPDFVLLSEVIQGNERFKNAINTFATELAVQVAIDKLNGIKSNLNFILSEWTAITIKTAKEIADRYIVSDE